jgi:hypothetical protein
MLVAFQGFPAPPGGKKTGAVMENVFVLGYNTILRQLYFKQFLTKISHKVYLMMIVPTMDNGYTKEL